jgi:hypothetical protein
MTDTGATKLTQGFTALAVAGVLMGLLFNSGAPQAVSTADAAPAVVATAPVAVPGVTP